MGRKSAWQPVLGPTADLDGAVRCIGAMTIDQLRGAWRQTFGSDPPAALSKDLMARALAYRLQERALGGLSPDTKRLLRSLPREGAEPPRRIKIGSVIGREHQGVVHEVLVVPNGFCWRGQTYASLSTIARAITGTSWNGPRFFGLRGSRKRARPVETPASEPTVQPKAGRRSSIGTRFGSERLRRTSRAIDERSGAVAEP